MRDITQEESYERCGDSSANAKRGATTTRGAGAYPQ